MKQMTSTRAHSRSRYEAIMCADWRKHPILLIIDFKK